MNTLRPLHQAGFWLQRYSGSLSGEALDAANIVGIAAALALNRNLFSNSAMTGNAAVILFLATALLSKATAQTSDGSNKKGGNNTTVIAVVCACVAFIALKSGDSAPP